MKPAQKLMGFFRDSRAQIPTPIAAAINPFAEDSKALQPSICADRSSQSRVRLAAPTAQKPAIVHKKTCFIVKGDCGLMVLTIEFTELLEWPTATATTDNWPHARSVS